MILARQEAARAEGVRRAAEVRRDAFECADAGRCIAELTGDTILRSAAVVGNLRDLLWWRIHRAHGVANWMASFGPRVQRGHVTRWYLVFASAPRFLRGHTLDFHA